MLFDRSSLASPAREWQPLLAEPLRGQALEVASQVAGHFRDPDHIFTIAQQTSQQTGTDPLAGTFGFYGGAFPCACFARYFPEQGWEKITHQYLDPARIWAPTFSHPGLFGGISGLALVMELISAGGRRYRKTLAELHQRFPALIQEAGWLQKEPGEVAENDYDAIRGAASTLAYLLSVPAPGEEVQAAITLLLDYLIHLAGSDPASRRERWYIAQKHIVLEENRRQYPQGYYNCSLSHGIPGPLAVLSLAWLAGYRVPGLREALVFLTDWIVQHAITDNWGINWPGMIPLQASYRAEDWRQLPPTRAAWCYGAPGVARALWLAGHALNEEKLCQVALEALEAVLRRPVAKRDIDAPTICHGISGLLAICLRFAHETESQTIREHIPLLTRQILEHYNPAFPLGFRNLENREQWIDETGWLTGAAGTALVLLAAALPVEPVWDRVLLLS